MGLGTVHFATVRHADHITFNSIVFEESFLHHRINFHRMSNRITLNSYLLNSVSAQIHAACLVQRSSCSMVKETVFPALTKLSSTTCLVGQDLKQQPCLSALPQSLHQSLKQTPFRFIGIPCVMPSLHRRQWQRVPLTEADRVLPVLSVIFPGNISSFFSPCLP